MVKDTTDIRSLLLMALLALWLAAWMFSFYQYLATPDQTAATLPRLSRTIGLLGWQGIAAVLAFGCWGVGWSFSKGTGIRRISSVPLWLAMAFLLTWIAIVNLGWV